jgi:RND family efflux transporter MFP subunit
LALGVVGVKAASSDSTAAASTSTTETVTRGDVTSTVSASGNIESATSLDVNFQQSGRLVSINVTKGAKVAAGDVLGKLDSSTQQAAVDSATASLESAKARQAKDLAGLSAKERSQLTAQEQQSNQSVSSAQISLDNAKASAEQNKVGYQNSVDQATTSLEQAKASLETTKTSVATDNSNAKTSQDNAQRTLDDAKSLLLLYRGNLKTAQGLYDPNAGGYATDSASVIARYTDDNTNCSNHKSGTGYDSSYSLPDGANCSQISSLQSLAQSVQKQESTVSSSQTSLDNAVSNVSSTKTKGESSITSANNQVTSAQNSYTNALNSQTSGLLKDQQSIDNARQSLSSSQASYKATVAGNDVKRDSATGETIASDASSVASAQQQLATAQRNLDDTILKAPVTGTVADIGYDVGAYISGGATAFVKLTDLADLRVKVGFSEADAIRVKVGQAASITLDSDDSKTFTGKVLTVDTTQTVVANVTTYYAEVSLIGNSDGVKPGMSATVDVTVAAKSNVLSLPKSAITTVGSTNSVLISTGEAGKTTTQPKTITVGLKGDDRTEIVSGLSEGDKVVVQSSAAGGAGGLPSGFRPPTGGLGGGIGG